MDKQQAKDLVKSTLGNQFDKVKFTFFVKNLLNKIDEAKAFHARGYVPESYKKYVKTYERIATYTDPEGLKIDILIVYLQNETTLERARTGQRNFIAHYLKDRDQKDAGLVAFVAPEHSDWRFSLVKMDYSFEEGNKGKIKVKEEFTPARRWSFLVGQNENSHTAQSRLLPIMADDGHPPTLAELEEVFNIETVTREFFIEYRNLFILVKESLDAIVAKDSTIKNNFAQNDVNTVDFAKKLLGQIVFLYFLQKKGWFGVAKNAAWGTGSKQFLRELFEKKHGGYNNFFNDILEPLFYEALRLDRGHEDHYYSRFNCKIPFLNGGLFDPIKGYDWVKTDILLPDELFSNRHRTKEGDTGNGILDVFDRYNFTVKEDEPLEKEVAIDPELLGKAYEKFNAIRPDNFEEYKKALTRGKKGDESKFNKQFGVYYTPREIVHYMCQQSLINYLAAQFDGGAVIYEKPGEKQTDLVGNIGKKGQLDLTIKHTENPVILKEDIETLIHLGERLSENEEMALIKQQKINEGHQKTSDYKLKLPESIRKNAKEIDEKLASIKVCDPAIGSGAFPVGMMSEIVRARNVLDNFIKDGARTVYNFKRECIENSLYGVDIDLGAVEIAKLRLWLSLVVDEDDIKNIKPLPNLDYKIVCGNSLMGVEKNLFNEKLFTELEKIKPLYLNETNPTRKQQYKNQIDGLISKITNGHSDFDFEVYFSEVLHENGGFDVVIANPPYVRVQNLEHQVIDSYKRKWETAWKRIDVSTLFIELGYSLLSKKGYSCIISSNQFITTEYGRMLRKFILQKKALEMVIDFADLPVFEALTYVSIFLFSKSSKEYFNYYKVTKLPFNITNDFLKISILSLTDDIWTLGRKEKLSLIKKMQSMPDRLNKYAKCWAGIITGNDNLLLYDINEKIDYIEKELLIPVIRAQNCARYSYASPSKKAFFPYEEIENKTKLITLRTLKKNYPKAYSFINNNNKELKKRKDSRHTIGEKAGWYGLIRFGRLARFRKPKIVSPGEVKNNKFTLDITGSAFSCARVFSITAENERVDIKYLLSILNSKLIEFYLHNNASLKQGGYYSYSSSVLDATPFIFNEEVQSIIVKIVDKILTLTQSSDYQTNKTKQSKVEEYEQEIDQIVYKLYDLTLDEITIVEETLIEGND